jgi:hypothetical protein
MTPIVRSPFERFYRDPDYPVDSKDEEKGDILYSFCQEKKVRKNKIFKNNELKIDPLFGNTSPSDSVHGFVFDFDESLARKRTLPLIVISIRCVTL